MTPPRIYRPSMVRIQLADGSDYDLADADEVILDGERIEIQYKAGGALAQQMIESGFDFGGKDQGVAAQWSVFLASNEWSRLLFNAPNGE